MSNSKFFFSLFITSICAMFHANAQDEIALRNPSFESPFMESKTKPICCKGPRGWYMTGLYDMNTPDAQPGNHGVNLPAAEGNFYIGMVTRDNDTWESISQRLKSPLSREKCYTFSMKISYSDDLVSQSRRTGKSVKYNRPVKVRVWAGHGYNQKSQLLDESPLIDHTYWKQYNFRFEPKKDYSYLIIEVFYKTPTPIPYNGNVLIDGISGIKMTPCGDEEEPPVVDINQPKPLNSSPSKPDPKPRDDQTTTTTATTTITTPAKNPKKFESKILNLDRKKMVEGQVIRIKKLRFDADSSTISSDAFPVLDEIYGFLEIHSDVSIEVGGHTNNRCETNFCDDLSEDRAKAVVDYLNEKGIRRNRLLYRGYGKRSPVATNATRTGRKTNQRVEIKILSLDG